MYLIAGYDETVHYARTDSAGARLQPTIEEVSATLAGVTVELSQPVTWDDEAEQFDLVILGSEKPSAGELVVLWSGTDPDGGYFIDSETCWVLASDAPDAGLVLRTRHFLRLDASDPVVPALVAAAQTFITNAGVSAPDPTDEGATALYELAVSLYVSTIYSGGEGKLEPAMTSVLLQLRS
jgi:hypothetical protein